MIKLAITAFILNLAGLCWSIFIVVSMLVNGDGNLVLFIPFILFVALTVFSLKGLKKLHNPRYKTFLYVNGVILTIAIIALIIILSLSSKEPARTYSNPQIGIESMQVPRGWITQNASDGSGAHFISPDGKTAIIFGLFSLQDGIDAQKVFSKDAILTVAKSISGTQIDTPSVQDKTINGMNWLVLNTSLPPDKYSRSAVHVIAANPSKYYQFSLNTNKADFALDATVFDELLSSVKLK